MKCKLWGTRGSIPVPGEQTNKYGGNTPCLQIFDEKSTRIIIDAGSGIRELGYELMMSEQRTLDIFFTHFHWDHIQGLLFFEPLYSDEFTINIYANTYFAYPPEELIDAQMTPAFFPIGRDVLKAKINFHKISANSTIRINGIELKTFETNHSKGTLSFKFVENGNTFIFLTDNELDVSNQDDISKFEVDNLKIIKYIEDADFLIHDSTYLNSDIAAHKYWGHSDNISTVRLANLASVKKVFLYHYDPKYNDKDVTEMVNQAKDELYLLGSKVQCEASVEGSIIEI